MADKTDDLGLPLKRTRGRPIKPLTFPGTYRVKEYKRKRGSWAERVENMRVGDAATNTAYYRPDEFNPKLAVAWFTKQTQTIRTAIYRVRKDNPAVRLYEFEVTKHQTEGANFSRICNITLTRTA